MDEYRVIYAKNPRVPTETWAVVIRDAKIAYAISKPIASDIADGLQLLDTVRKLGAERCVSSR